MIERLFNVFVAALVLTPGCAAATRPAPRETRAALVAPATRPSTPSSLANRAPIPTGTPQFVYWQVDEAEAETVLVAAVIADGRASVYELPLRRYAPGERPPEDVFANQSIGEGVYESVRVDDDPRPGVTLRVSRTPPTVLGFLFGIGGVRARVTVPTDLPSEWELSDDATLAVSYREPKRPPPRAAEPWEEQLDGRRTEPADVPLPPPWPAASPRVFGARR